MCDQLINRGNGRVDVFHKDGDFRAFVDRIHPRVRPRKQPKKKNVPFSPPFLYRTIAKGGVNEATSCLISK